MATGGIKFSFNLAQYARFKQPSGVNKDEAQQWVYFDNTKEKLELTLSDGHILLTHGKTILESFNVLNGKDCIRGFCKGESILIVSKIKGESRRFRMKFLKDKCNTGEDLCKVCAENLSKLFPVKMVSGSKEEQSKEVTEKDSGTQSLSGEVTLSTMAKAVTGELKERLPSVYQKVSNTPSQNLNTFLRLCLSDPNFPAFVGQVETEINKIKELEKL